MSEQDADDTASGSADARDDDGQQDDQPNPGVDEVTSEENVAGNDDTAKPGSETLEEIAAEPADSVEDPLDSILDTDEGEDEERAEAGDEDPAERTGPDMAELVTFVEESEAETVAELIEALRAERVELATELETERERADDLESRLSRKQADFQNYKKRQEKQLEEEKQRATEDLVERLLDVRDNLARALDQDEDTDIRGGVESTLSQFDEELDRENVSVIEPELGDEVDPQRHEVLITVESSEPEDTVAQLHRPGYEMAGKVLRPAQVAVSDGSQADTDASGEDSEAPSDDSSENGE